MDGMYQFWCIFSFVAASSQACGQPFKVLLADAIFTAMSDHNAFIQYNLSPSPNYTHHSDVA